MRGVWLYLKKSLSCCSLQRTNYSIDPGDPDKNRIRKTKNPSGCSRSMSNLRDVFVTNGDGGVMQNPSCFNSRSLESSNRLMFSGATSSDWLTDCCCSERFDVVGSDLWVLDFLLVENVMRDSEILTLLRRITSLTTLSLGS